MKLLERHQVTLVRSETFTCTGCAFITPDLACTVQAYSEFNCVALPTLHGIFVAYKQRPNKLVASRNKREGHYIGKNQGTEYRRGPYGADKT